MAEKLTPDLLDGIKHTETVELEHGGKVYEVEIRPLKNSEAAKVRAEQWKALKINADLFGTGDSKTKKEARANLLAKKLERGRPGNRGPGMDGGKDRRVMAR